MINKKIKSIFMVLIVLLNMISPSTVVAAWNKSEIDNGIYVIESSVGRGKVLDICEAKKEDGANLQIWEASENLGNSLNQLFYIDRNEDGSYAIVSLHASKFLGVKEEENKEVKQYNPSFRDNCKWEISAKNNDEYELKLKSSGLSLDVCEGKNQNGTRLHLWESNNTEAQRFRLHKLDIEDATSNEIHEMIDVRRNQSKLEEIQLEGGIEKVTKYMVSHFEKLKTVYISTEVSEIEEGAFSDCKSIEAVWCEPKMLKGFDKSGIKTIWVSDGVKTLEKKDFQGLENLENIILPESIEKIEEGTFENFKNIRELYCDSKWFKYFNKAKVEDLEKLKSEIIKNKEAENQKDIQYQIECYKEKIKILKDRLSQLGVKSDEITTKNNGKLSDTELLKKLKDETENLTEKYINKCLEIDRKSYEQLIENSVKTIRKNNDYKTEELSFGEKENSESQTTIEEIVKLDENNKKYAKYAGEILQNLEKGIESNNRFRRKSLDSISKEISSIFKKIKDTYGITPYPVQVMTVLRLSDEILNGKNTIAEVKTGEGKSFIIAVLALVLSKYGHKVDVVTSTEELARRDNENQKKYYELFGVKSGVLKKESEESNHAQNEFNLEVLEREIVYSTNSNFEFLHLGSIFKKEPDRKRKYDVVIVDEVDNMLLDQSSMPAIISEMITIKNRNKIFEDIYNNRQKEEIAIINGIKKYFEKKEIPLETIEELILAARMADTLEKDKDYVVKDNEVIIIDSSTGYKKPGSRWSNYIHEMLELKEGIKLKETSVSNSMITQKSYFKMYEHITGLTGTVGNEKDKELLEETYRVKTFKMPRNKTSKQKVEYIKRERDVFNQIKKEIELKKKEKTPVLVILPTNAMVNEFTSRYFPNSKKITGVELEEDREAIKDAGKSGRVTIATNAAGRGIDIELDENSKKNKGLHVIIPYMPENERILEQAMGRSARQGQPGSVSIYYGNGDVFYETPGFEKNYDKLLEIQNKFAEYVKKNYGWLYREKRGNKILFESEYELGITPGELLKESARELSMRLQWIKMRDEETEQILVDTMRNILMKAWGVYFSRTSDNIHEYSDPQEIEDEYEEFLENLEEYFPKDKKNVSEAVSHITSTEQLKMIDELAGEILKTIGILMQMLPEPVKKVLENRAVQGVMKVTGGVSEIATGCGLCTTAVGCIQGIPLIIFGTNMAFEGIQDLWYTLRGELDHESKNLIKEATGHKVDNLVELSEIGMSIYAGKVASKKITGKLGEESEKLSGLLKKTRKPVSIVTRTKRLVRKFMPKKRYRKFKVVDVEELAKKQCLKPNIQLFADDIGEPIYKLIHGEKKNIRLHLGHHKKHFLDVNNKNYIEGKSILYISAEEAQELLNEFAGKGNFADKFMHKEIVDFGKVIGEYVKEGTDKRFKTTRGTIHYGKKGVHIVPAKPNSLIND